MYTENGGKLLLFTVTINLYNMQHRKEQVYVKNGMLTSGGDCQALNAAMRGVVKGLFQNVTMWRFMDSRMDIKD